MIEHSVLGEFFNAAKDGHLDKLKSLVLRRSKPQIHLMAKWTTNGLTPLTIACCNRHLEVVAFLLDECDVSTEQGSWVGPEEDEGGWPMDEAIRALFDVGRRCLVVDGATPLWFAAFGRNYDVMRYLLSRGANINCRTRLWQPLLIEASCVDDRREMFELLLEHDAYVDVTDGDGVTPLMAACGEGNQETAAALVARAADVNHVDRNGNTALDYAAMSSSFQCLHLLIRHEAQFQDKLKTFTPLLKVQSSTNPSRVIHYIIIPFCCAIESPELTSLGASSEKIFANDRFSWTIDQQRVVRVDSRDGQVSYNTIEGEQTQLGNRPDQTGSESRMDAIKITTERLPGHSIDETKYYYSYNGHFTKDDNSDYDSMWNVSMQLHRTAVTTDSLLFTRSISLYVDLFTKLIKKYEPLPSGVIMAVFVVTVRAIHGGQLIEKRHHDENMNSVVALLFLIIVRLRLGTPRPQWLTLTKFLRRMAMLDLRDSRGATVMHLVCSSMAENAWEVLKVLFENKAKHDLVDDRQNTLCHVLARGGRPDKHYIIHMLLQQGVKRNATNSDRKRFSDYLPENDKLQYLYWRRQNRSFHFPRIQL